MQNLLLPKIFCVNRQTISVTSTYREMRFLQRRMVSCIHTDLYHFLWQGSFLPIRLRTESTTQLNPTHLKIAFNQSLWKCIIEVYFWIWKALILFLKTRDIFEVLKNSHHFKESQRPIFLQEQFDLFLRQAASSREELLHNFKYALGTNLFFWKQRNLLCIPRSQSIARSHLLSIAQSMRLDSARPFLPFSIRELLNVSSCLDSVQFLLPTSHSQNGSPNYNYIIKAITIKTITEKGKEYTKFQSSQWGIGSQILCQSIQLNPTSLNCHQ